MRRPHSDDAAGFGGPIAKRAITLALSRAGHEGHVVAGKEEKAGEGA
jgi:hypothetical protein